MSNENAQRRSVTADCAAGQADPALEQATSGHQQPNVGAQKAVDQMTIARFCSFHTLVFLALWSWFLIDGRSWYLRDPGVLWHTVVGRQILSTGQFPHMDQFSFTCARKPWIASNWLAECFMAILHSLDELDGLLLGAATGLAGFYTWLTYRLSRSGMPWWLALFLLAAALRASSYHFIVRPHLATIAFLGWTFARLCDFEANRISARGLIWLVPVSVVWANTHGGVVGGIGTVAIAVIGWSVAKLADLPTPLTSYGRILPLWGLVLCCVLAVLVNPYGLALPQTWFTVMTSSVVHQHILEHQPLSWSRHSWPVVFFGLIYLTALASVSPYRVRVTWLLPVLWFYLAWTRLRHGPLFATVAVLALAEMYPRARWLTCVSRLGGNVFHIPAGRTWQMTDWRSGLMPIVVVAAAFLLQVNKLPMPVWGHGWARLDPAVWPVELLPELREYEGTHRAGTPIYNDMHYGGFLIYFTPNLRVFIDDRCELYGDDRLLAYVQAHVDELDRINDWSQKYGFDRVLTIAGSTVDVNLRHSNNWRIVRQAKAATLYERIDAPINRR
jgi:hypothetical protein